MFIKNTFAGCIIIFMHSFEVQTGFGVLEKKEKQQITAPLHYLSLMLCNVTRVRYATK